MDAQITDESKKIYFAKREFNARFNELLSALQAFVIATTNIKPTAVSFHTDVNVTTHTHLKCQKSLSDKILNNAGIGEFYFMESSFENVANRLAKNLIRFSNVSINNGVPPAFEIELSIKATA